MVRQRALSVSFPREAPLVQADEGPPIVRALSDSYREVQSQARHTANDKLRFGGRPPEGT